MPGDTFTEGALSTTNSYVTASLHWYDGLGRATATVDYGREDVDSGLTHYIFHGSSGSDAGGAYDAGDLIDVDRDGIPDEAQGIRRYSNTSDDYIVSATAYNSDTGRPTVQIDNLGRIDLTEYDDMGRVIRTIENYHNGTVTETDTDRDVTVEYEYDYAGRLVTMTAYNAMGDDSDPNHWNVDEQKTIYLYTSTINPSWRTEEVYPDSSDVLTQNATTKVWTYTTDNGDHVETYYDRLGRLTAFIDQRGVIRTYTYVTDASFPNDRAVYLGTSGVVDNSVLRIETIYDDVGRVQKVTSYADTAGYNPLNQVEYVYNGWGNVYREYQEHSGTVDANTPFVQYDYADGGSGGVAKYVRLEKVTYPDGREVHYDYGTAGAIDDIMSRLASIKDDDGSTVLASYKYLGAGRIVTEDYEEIEVKLDYNANDNLGGLDRFGRVADQVWNDYGATPDVVLDRYTYTYDRVGNRTSRDNELHAAFDEDYTYDALYRLTDTARADAFDQSWTLDGLGNWGSFDDDGTSQDRTVNEANEIQSISGGWITPQYDAAGNMKSGPTPGDETTRVHHIYDPWNRLTQVRADDSGSPGALIASYSYDGLNRRIEKEVTAGSVDTHYYYNTSWQCLEQRVEVSGALPAAADVQYVWGAGYVDNLILRDRDTNASGTMDERLYALSDANHNVTALVDAATGAIVERFLYDPYGTVTELDPDFTPYTGTDYDWEYTYTTRRLDEETGLMYYRHRYYDAGLGRFVSRDPIGYRVGLNLYGYVTGRPLSSVDPLGLAPAIYIVGEPGDWVFDDDWGWAPVIDDFQYGPPAPQPIDWFALSSDPLPPIYIPPAPPIPTEDVEIVDLPRKKCPGGVLGPISGWMPGPWPNPGDPASGQPWIDPGWPGLPPLGGSIPIGGALPGGGSWQFRFGQGWQQGYIQSPAGWLDEMPWSLRIEWPTGGGKRPRTK